MKDLNKQMMVEAGGNVWEKNGIERVYMSLQALRNLAALNNYLEAFADPSKKMKQAKTFFDVKTNELKSDVGMIRSSLNSMGFDCSK